MLGGRKSFVHMKMHTIGARERPQIGFYRIKSINGHIQGMTENGHFTREWESPGWLAGFEMGRSVI